MPRLFTGLEIPKEVAQWLSLLRGGLPGARWIDPENYHITLRFIGDIDDRLAHEIASLLDGVRRRSFEVRFGDLMLVRRAQAARHRGGGRADPAAGGTAVRARATDAAPRARAGGAQVHRRMSRSRGCASPRAATSPSISSTRGPVFGSSFRVSRFVLFSSRSSVGGGPYVIEADYPLAA